MVRKYGYSIRPISIVENPGVVYGVHEQNDTLW